ncbi:MAG: hypothetical protein ACU84Q_09210 [Gammaproteobacteria bacterium]
MNWDAIGAVGEIVGAIAVVISLVYVAVQIRQNTAAVRVSTHQDLLANQTAAQHIAAANPQVAELWQQADDDYDGLSPAERKQFTVFSLNMFNTFQSARFSHEADLLPEEVWEAWVRGYAAIIGSSPGFRREWVSLRELYTPNIRHVVDKLVTEHEKST